MEIIITSDNQNPADFVASYNEALDIDTGYEVAIKSIFHAPVYNITTDNNRFSVAKSNDGTDNQLSLSIAHFEIAAGFYESRCEIMAAMYKAIADTVAGIQLGFDSTNPHDRAILNYAPVFSVSNGTLTLDMANPKKNTSRDRTMTALHAREYKFFVIDPAVYIDSSIFPVLGYCNSTKQFLPKLEVDDLRIDSGETAGFVYSNIVENSLINQNRSRLLAVVPISSRPGHNYIEFKNPVYRPLPMHSITDITCVITDVKGTALQLDNVYMQRKHFKELILPTIITLHLRKRRGI